MTVKTIEQKVVSSTKKKASELMQVLWDLNECRLMPTDFKNKMTKLAFPQDLIDKVPDFDENKAVRTAAKKWKKGRGESSMEGVIVYENDDVIGVGVLQMENVADKEKARKQIDCYEWDKQKLHWKTTPSTSSGMQQLRFIERQLKGFSSNEVTKYVIMPMVNKYNGFPLRKRGGVYMMENSKASMQAMQAVEAFVEGCNNGNEFHIYTLSLSQKTRDSAKRALSSSIKNKLKDIEKTIEGWKTSSRKPKGGGESVFTKLEDLKQQLKTTKEILQADMTDLEKIIEEARKAGEVIIDNMEKVSPMKKPKALSADNVDELLSRKEGEDQNSYRMRATMILLGADNDVRTQLYSTMSIEHEGKDLWSNVQALVEAYMQ